MQYGSNELRYAQPIADGLCQNTEFKEWFLSKTDFKDYSKSARLLFKEQNAARSSSESSWWRSYWAGSSYVYKKECGERETDLLAIFDVPSKLRFALHIEVKAPGDRFGLQQAEDYVKRAKCWAGPGRNPRSVLPHDVAACVLCCESKFLKKYGAEASFFNKIITFSEIETILSPFPMPLE